MFNEIFNNIEILLEMINNLKKEYTNLIFY